MSKTPLTAEQSAQLTRDINALPEPLRSFVVDLETEADPAGTIRQNFLLRAENASLRTECDNLDVDAARYRHIRNQPEDAIGKRAVFARMMSPMVADYTLTGEDLDRAVDAGMAQEASKP